MLLVLLGFLVLLATVMIASWYVWYFKFYRRLKNFPTTEFLPLFGSALLFPSTTALYTKLFQLKKELGPNFWFMLGIEPVLVTSDPKLVKIILSSSKFINKSRTYRFLHNWLGLGLITSSGERWRKHRKILTQAFHFKILEEFSERINSASDVLVRKLAEEVGKASTDVHPYVTLCSLDVICDSTMGINVNAQMNAESNYVQSVKELTRIIIERTIRPIENFDFTYYFTTSSKNERLILKYLHDFTDSVIQQRRGLFSEKQLKNGPKKKLAFLDLLLSHSESDGPLSDRDIRQEVDTFMFAGHDTTSSAVSFTLLLLANNPREQEKAFSEIRNVLRDDNEKTASFQDFQEMRYLELVIKEALRLYPSVPFFARELKEDLDQDGFCLPKGLTVTIAPFMLHREEDIFPDALAFKPERHLEEEKVPFSYVPFSAGPRNCIGQKFAMLSMKSTVSKVLRHYELLPVKHEMEMAAETILKSKNGVLLQLKERKW